MLDEFDFTDAALQKSGFATGAFSRKRFIESNIYAVTAKKINGSPDGEWAGTGNASDILKDRQGGVLNMSYAEMLSKSMKTRKKLEIVQAFWYERRYGTCSF